MDVLRLVLNHATHRRRCDIVRSAAHRRCTNVLWSSLLRQPWIAGLASGIDVDMILWRRDPAVYMSHVVESHNPNALWTRDHDVTTVYVRMLRVQIAAYYLDHMSMKALETRFPNLQELTVIGEAYEVLDVPLSVHTLRCNDSLGLLQGSSITKLVLGMGPNMDIVDADLASRFPNVTEIRITSLVNLQHPPPNLKRLYCYSNGYPFHNEIISGGSDITFVRNAKNVVINQGKHLILEDTSVQSIPTDTHTVEIVQRDHAFVTPRPLLVPHLILRMSSHVVCETLTHITSPMHTQTISVQLLRVVNADDKPKIQAMVAGLPLVKSIDFLE